MIVINVQLPTASLYAIAVGLVAIAPAALGLILSVHSYSHIRDLQIPAALTAACSILIAISAFGGIPWPYKWIQLTACGIMAIASGGSGLYFIAEKLSRPAQARGHWNLEIAFIATWLVSIMAAFAHTFFCLGERWLARYDPEEQHFSDEEHLQEKPPQSVKSLSDIPHVAHLGAPLGFTADHIQVQPPRNMLSPRLSWPSSIGSAVRPASFGSMRSVLDTRPVTPPPPPPAPAQAHHQTGSQPPKSPKSPLKLHLTKSSFSLRRSPSKNATNVSAAHLPSPHGSQSTMPSLDSLPNNIPTELPNGMPLLASAVPEPGKQQKWVIFPNQNPAESRSVSGSSQLTGTVFPASEYNRKINSAGFQRDEPMPIQAQLLKSQPSLSQYDMERLHATRGHP